MIIGSLKKEGLQRWEQHNTVTDFIFLYWIYVTLKHELMLSARQIDFVPQKRR